MREVTWHKDPETGRYTLVQPWNQFWTVAGLTIGDILYHHGRYHFTTMRQTFFALGNIMSSVLATTIGATSVIVVVLASRMFLDRRRAKLARNWQAPAA
jgi:hypothetical protein